MTQDVPVECRARARRAGRSTCGGQPQLRCCSTGRRPRQGAGPDQRCAIRHWAWRALLPLQRAWAQRLRLPGAARLQRGIPVRALAPSSVPSSLPLATLGQPWMSFQRASCALAHPCAPAQDLHAACVLFRLQRVSVPVLAGAKWRAFTLADARPRPGRSPRRSPTPWAWAAPRLRLIRRARSRRRWPVLRRACATGPASTTAS